MKKALCLMLASIFLLAAVLTGCGSGANQGNSGSNTASSSTPAGNAAPVSKVLNYWYPWGGDSEKWEKWRIAEFEKDNPGYKVNATYVPTDGGLSNGKLLASIAGGNPPDLDITTDPAGGYGLSAQGALEPIDKYLQAAGFKESDMIQSFIPLMKYNGQTYIFPMDSNVDMLFFNKKLFKEAGLDPNNPPKTIAELDKYAEQLTKVNNGKIDRLGFIPWIDSGDDPIFELGWVFGANFYDPKTNKVELNTKPLIDLYNWQNSYAKKYNPEKMKSFTSGFGGAFSPDHPFFTGKVAMTLNGNWFTNALKLYAPNVDYGVAPIPYPEGGRENATSYGTNLFFVPKGAKNPEAAIKFILYTENQPKILANDIDTWRSIPVMSKQFKDVSWIKNNDATYKIIQKIAESPNAGHPALVKVAKEMGDGLRALRDSVIYNNKDPQPLLAELESKLQKEMDKK